MRAAVVERYGPPEVVAVRDVARPTPNPNQVLVRVRATAVTSGDARIRAARFPPGFAVPARVVFGLSGPRRRTLGSAFSGVLEVIGSRVSGFGPGDEVSGLVGMAMGAHAEYVAVDAKRLAAKPPEVSHDDAAGILFGGAAAMPYLRDKAEVRSGQTVLVNGASGAVGTAAVQLASRLGAVVTGVTSTANVGLVKELGADHVVDYTVTDLAALAAGQQRYDVVLDTVGNLSRSSGRGLLAEGGVLLLAVAGLGETVTARGNVKAGPAAERIEDVRSLLAGLATGELRTVIDQVYDLDEIVAAHRRVDSGHKVGNVLLRC